MADKVDQYLTSTQLSWDQRSKRNLYLIISYHDDDNDLDFINVIMAARKYLGTSKELILHDDDDDDDLDLINMSKWQHPIGGSKKPKYKNSKSTLQFLVAFCFLKTNM